MDFNNYSGHIYYSETERKAAELKQQTLKTKAEKKKNFHNVEELNSVWESGDCATCIHKEVCKYKHNGYWCKYYRKED